MARPPSLIRAFQWDLARQVERLDWLLAQLPRYADWGYQELYIHLEDAVEFPSLPGVARKDAYSYQQFTRLVKAAGRVGIKVVPIVNLLGHTQYLIKVPELRDLNELRHPDGSPQETGQICPLHPRTLEIAKKLLRDVLPFCTAGKVHVGLDESFALGQHPLSKREIKRIGRAAHFARHVHRLRKLTASLGLEMGMWADMLYFLPDAIPLLPSGIAAYDWYYYPFLKHPRVELFNYRERDLATPLQKQGIKYWGCPMNGAFRHEPLPHFQDRLANIKSWWKRCHQTQAEGMLITSWEPNRLAMESTTLVDAAAAELWLNPAQTHTHEQMLVAGLQRTFSLKRPAAIAKALLASDQHAFTGYPRWEINKSWPLASGPKSISTYRREHEFFNQLRRSAKSWPSPLQASMAYRHYLATRDLRVRTWRDRVQSLRRNWQRGRHEPRLIQQLQQQVEAFLIACQDGSTAATDMWRATRSTKGAAPNLLLLSADKAQAQAFIAWLRECLVRPTHIMSRCPVAGEGMLKFTVWNFAPAVQKISADQKIGSQWHAIKTCHTIEFLGRSASPSSRSKQHHVAPLSLRPNQTPQIRFRLSGVGQIRIGNIEVIHGSSHWQVNEPLAWKEMGQPPREGWPILDHEEQHVPKLIRKTP